jgi:hypothetical protein
MFQLTKVWVDSKPNPGTVEIRYTWSAIGQPGKWEGQEEAEVMALVPDTRPQIRQAVLEIPRYVDGQDNYLLHYQFGGGGEHHEGFSRIFTEEIVAREVAHVDAEGRITEMRALWSVGGWAAPNWSKAKLEDLNLFVPDDAAGHDLEGEGVADEAIYELVRTVPLPRRFVAKVWGPRGATVEYVLQLIRSGSPDPGEDFHRWDNRQGQNYSLTLT